MSAQKGTPIAALLTTAALLGFCGTALADQEADSGRRIAIADLDLSQTSDVAVLYDRIRLSARIVCSDAGAPWDGRKFENQRRCIEDAVDRAVATVDHPRLTALHQRAGERVASR